MYAALSWVPRGVMHAKLPTTVPPHVDAKDETDAMQPVEASSGSEVEEEEDADAEVDVGDLLASDLDTLSLFKSNTEDPYLRDDPDAAAVFDADELDDLVVRPTDSFIVASKSGEDASILEFHLLEDDPANSDDDKPYKPHFYVHHDVVLPTLPLCSAFTTLRIGDSSPLNLVAVGCFTPGIDIWDIERVNVLEPAMILGGFDMADDADDESDAAGASAKKDKKAKKAAPKTKSKKKRAKKLQLKEGSHSDAVMSLSWNQVQREYLASGSADTTVKLWDVESAHCARTLTHHSDKVQSVAWHPTEEATLMTGSFDKTVQLVDVRAAEKPSHTAWSLKADVESASGALGKGWTT
jgi:periodic tryptophan protein 1